MANLWLAVLIIYDDTFESKYGNCRTLRGPIVVEARNKQDALTSATAAFLRPGKGGDDAEASYRRECLSDKIKTGIAQVAVSKFK